MFFSAIQGQKTILSKLSCRIALTYIIVDSIWKRFSPVIVDKPWHNSQRGDSGASDNSKTYGPVLCQGR